ncbi:class 3 adenylate cyclase/predicted ATPase/DNA-binding transcriptional ArsR family regulator [Bradyrhizobium sp. USDA 4524]|uniref:adenylate/guanylate cyclase domain-containing protein n=1 Tax=unclassified Bradyrhizobium TaxID=2631580 RepID=UPI00209F4772|nr:MULTISPECIES: adenylate/guanylate cyclase domain-containing protein [unclassified Bradyrhizobium]MCP1845175.1 class 3 adenylate cyclase/predicted ATPase/DNA-binding transcriptional ArsR family regulator [Bradyrhizobium sp. USDA 4538]MCP1905740.1 class 3 adenylate cyclase/predicted ATPase/DNA-binding transcriptional ArsR family regulator [Bradyrhizobium sp. USDA 4537]MCP1988604.1 class 3 adenylate cyclase/predicted ATPase/DNA-binding transcriptional ArsR family regulator [Bradyrhizobium sp. US
MSSQPKPDRSGGLQRTQAPPNAENEDLHAERRQLTVVFIDIVGSTPLSERIDPEEFFAVIRTYRDICDEQIRRYGGHIARMIGDGLLAYFGVPQAHENDPERAVRASLAVAAAIKDHNFLLSDGSFVRLGVRVGVNTGVVVVGSVPGEPPDRREVFGSSAHVAARLQGLASENGVVVGSSTYELTRGTFSYVPLGRRPLKGIEEPVEAWRAEALASSESRFDRARRSPLAPMIARTGESTLLAEMWQQSLAGSGQVGVISGEPGIGKSRLIRQFRSSLDASPRDVLSLQCSPFHVNTPLAPEIERLTRATGIQDTDDAQLALAKLRSLLARAVTDVEQALRYYGAVLSIPACPGYEPADLGSPAERERALQVFVDALLAASRKRPILGIVEDVQWMDPTTIELLVRVIARCSSERIMVLITHRDDYRADWLTGPAIRRIALQKLAVHECKQMVAAVAGSDLVPRRIANQIVERTDGVPLFVEEFTRAIVDAGAIPRPAESHAPSGKLPESLVPASIHDSLMERLDRLGPAKRVAQIASVFGRRFNYDGIFSVLPGKGQTLKHALRALETAGIVYRSEESQGNVFTFKHAMIQEVAYSSLLKEERRELHARVASWLLPEAAIGESSQPAVLGYHYARAGNIPEAIEAWLQAGKSALRSSATKEAVAHLREGLSLIPKMPASPRRFEAEIALQSNLAMAYTANAGWSDPNVYGSYSRALKLCASHGTIREKATVLWGSTIAKLVNCELTKGLENAHDFVRRAEEWRDDEAALMAHTAAEIANFFLGRLEQASELAALVRARYNSSEHGKLVQIYQHDPLIVSLVYSGHIEWLLGRPGRARECCVKARQLANEIGHPFMQAFASILGVADHWYEGDLAANLTSVKRGLKVADEYGYPMYRVIGPLWATAALVARGPAPEVLEQLCGLLGRLPAENRCIQIPLYRILLATEFGRIGQMERARSFAASAESLMKKTGERWAAPEIYRIHGSLLCREPLRDDRAAMRLFKRSLASARKLGAVGWELRTAISIARLVSAGESASGRAEARDLLISTRAKFATAETSRDLREADDLVRVLN